MKVSTIKEELNSLAYHGRGIIIGKSADGKKAVTAYFIMGRSVNSRNRVFVAEGDAMRTRAYDESKMVVFRVVNEAQKDWVESKLLHDLEGNFRSIMGSMKVYVRVEVAPDDSPQEKKIYMPSEQAEALMAQNDEVKNLVKDFELDIK